MSNITDDRYRKKDWFICENCSYTNIINVVKDSKREKKQHMIWCDDPTWSLFKSMAGEFGYDHARMLAFLFVKLHK